MSAAADLYRTLSLKEAAEYLRIHPETLRQLALSGQIAAAKPGRSWVFLQADLVDYLRSKQGGECHSRDAAGSGGSTSRSVDDEYSEVLGLPENRPRRSSTTD